MVSRRAIAAVVTVIAVAIVGLVAFLIVQRGGLNPPNFEITRKELTTTVEGFPPDYVAYVSVTVKNRGGAGTMTVYVKVMQGGNSWQKSQSVYLDSGESQDLTFKFSEIAFWTDNPVSYDVWIE